MTDKRMIAVFHYDNGRCGSEPYKYEELKRGKWVWGNEKKSWHKCSVCGESAYSYYDELADDVEELFDYCPYCGADMRAEQTEPFDKDINVRSKTEPQTDCEMPYKDCEDCETHLKAQAQNRKTEPQTERNE